MAVIWWSTPEFDGLLLYMVDKGLTWQNRAGLLKVFMVEWDLKVSFALYGTGYTTHMSY